MSIYQREGLRYKLRYTINKLQTIYKKIMEKPYDLEKRTLGFAKEIIGLCKKLSKDVINMKLIGQLIKAPGSVGPNQNFKEGGG